MELQSYPIVDNLPPRVPLHKALELPTNAFKACQGIAVTTLNLSVRPLNCFAKNDIKTIDTLLSLTLNDLFDIPAMGRTSVDEVIRRICDFCFDPPARPVSNPVFAARIDTALEWTPLTLRDEWNTYSYGANVNLPISLLPLAPEASRKLQEFAVCWLEEILSWTLDDARARLGEEDAEHLLVALIATAQEQRNFKITMAEDGTISRETRIRLLTQRWARTSIGPCGLKSRTRALLASASVRDFGQLLEALDPLIPALRLDLPAFLDIWNALVALDLRQGDAFSEWEQCLGNEQYAVILDDVVTAMQLVCTERQWGVLCLRFGLLPTIDKPQGEISGGAEPERLTLEEVAQKLDITRERVRQIELSAMTKLQEVETDAWQSIVRTLRFLMCRAGGVLTLADAAQELTTRFPADAINAANVCYLLFELSDAFASIQRGKIYRLASIPASHYALIIERATGICKGSLVNLSEEELAHRVLESLATEQVDIDLAFIVACLQTDDRFSSELTRRDLTFHLMETLRRLGRPAHYTEIAATLNGFGWRWYHLSEKSVNSRLGGERDVFVYLDRGVYGLAEWGLEDRRVFDRQRNGFIGDHIETFLTERDEPAETAEIVAYVLSKKRCQEFSVLMSLSRDGRFHAFGRGRYGLKKWVV